MNSSSICRDSGELQPLHLHEIGKDKGSLSNGFFSAKEIADERIGYLEDPNVLPCVGNDAYTASPGGDLALPLEAYESSYIGLTLVQQRSPVIKGMMIEYEKNLETLMLLMERSMFSYSLYWTFGDGKALTCQVVCRYIIYLVPIRIEVTMTVKGLGGIDCKIIILFKEHGSI